MHHRQTLQEKNKLIIDIKRLLHVQVSGVWYDVYTIIRMKKHYSSYEPAMQQLKQKYEVGGG